MEKAYSQSFTQARNYDKIPVFSALLNPFCISSTSSYCDPCPMQFFDLSRQFNLDQMITPSYNLNELAEQDWFLAKVRVEYDCLNASDSVAGQVVLKSNCNVEIELAWIIQDTGHALHVLFEGIETQSTPHSGVMLKGARLCDVNQKPLSAQALSLWIDGTLLPMLPHLRREIKAHLNLWDYVEYEN